MFNQFMEILGVMAFTGIIFLMFYGFYDFIQTVYLTNELVKKLYHERKKR